MESYSFVQTKITAIVQTIEPSAMLCGCSMVIVKPSAKVITIETYGNIVRTIPTAIVYTIRSALSWLETFLDRWRNCSIRAGVAEW